MDPVQYQRCCAQLDPDQDQGCSVLPLSVLGLRMLSLAGFGAGSGMLCPDGSNVGSGTLCLSSCTRHDDVLGSGGSPCCHSGGSSWKGVGDGHRARLLSTHEWPWVPAGPHPAASQNSPTPPPASPVPPHTPLTNLAPCRGPSPSEFSPNPCFPNPSHLSKTSGRRHPLKPLLINPLSGIH